MVQPNVRASLTRDDAQLALHVIASGRAEDLEEGERLLATDGVDVLLDDPRLLIGLLRTDRGMIASYALVAYVVMRHALTHVGESDRNLADFMASLFMEFGVRDRAHRLSRLDDETYETLGDIAAAADSSDPRRSFLARVHLGNYALWLSGVYPDHIEERRWRRGGPNLEYYESMGRKGYQLAAGHRLAKETGVSDFYALVAERFRVMRIALTSVSDALLFPHSNSPTSIIRRVEDDFRLTS
jgi:hypothetical protein